MGTVYLTDFGLAKASATGSRYTRTGQALGTPAYMSPEQARGEGDLTPATDVWSLGCILHELLAGRCPFEGATAAEVIGGVLTGEPVPLRRARPDVPPGLATVVAAALAKAARQRPRTARDLRDDLDRILRGERPASRPRRGGRTAAAVVAALALGAAGLALARRARPSVPAGPTPAEALAVVAHGRRSADPADAARMFGEALALAPDRVDWRIERGLALWASGDGPAARREWGAVPDAAPESPRALLYLALEAFFRLSGPDAEPALTSLVHTRGREARIARGVALAMEARWPELRQVLADEPGWEAALVRAYAAGNDPSGDRRVALREYDRALAEGIGFGWAIHNRGLVKLDLGDVRGALADFDAAVRLLPGEAKTWLNRGVARSSLGEFRDALPDYDAALARDPDHVDARINRAIARVQLSDLAGAVADCDAVLHRQPDEPRALALRGEARQRGGDLAAAVVDFDAALRLDAGAAETWYRRGVAKGQLGDLAGSIADLDEAIRRRPAYAPALVSRGAAKGLQGDFQAGLADLDAALQLEPDAVDGLRQRARTRYELRDLAGARADYDRLVAIVPRDADVWADRGIMALLLGEPSAAAADFTRALDLAGLDWPHRARIERMHAQARAAGGRESGR